MKQVKKSVLVGYTPNEMYELVNGFERYPEFLPWCEKAQVIELFDNGLVARLGLAYMGVRHSFTTRNENRPGESVAIRLVDGPFSVLDGSWLFHPLGAAGAAVVGCKIEFEMRYGFSSGALERVVSPVFDKIANTFVDSFVKRAEVVYGPR
jgi:ribosome-associated toxin RatA of RatAB toxin-antitoxin module